MKCPARRCPSGSMPWPRFGRTCHSTAMPAAASCSRALCRASTGIRSSASPWMRRTGGRAVDLGEVLGPGQQARVADDGGRGSAAAQADVQGEHGALAEAGEHEALGAEAIAGELGIEEAVERRPGRHHAAPALVRVAEGEGEPLQCAHHAGDGLRRIGGDEHGLRQPAAPAVGQRDEVVPVGAVAVQQHHQRRGAAPGLDARSVKLLGHAECVTRRVADLRRYAARRTSRLTLISASRRRN